MYSNRMLNYMAKRELSKRHLSEKHLSKRHPAQRHLAAREFGMNHSELAMMAAKRMSRSKQKEKNGRVICHHLRMMLVSGEPVVYVARPSVAPVHHCGQQQITLGF